MDKNRIAGKSNPKNKKEVNMDHIKNIINEGAKRFDLMLKKLAEKRNDNV